MKLLNDAIYTVTMFFSLFVAGCILPIIFMTASLNVRCICNVVTLTSLYAIPILHCAMIAIDIARRMIFGNDSVPTSHISEVGPLDYCMIMYKEWMVMVFSYILYMATFIWAVFSNLIKPMFDSPAVVRALVFIVVVVIGVPNLVLIVGEFGFLLIAGLSEFGRDKYGELYNFAMILKFITFYPITALFNIVTILSFASFILPRVRLHSTFSIVHFVLVLTMVISRLLNVAVMILYSKYGMIHIGTLSLSLINEMLAIFMYFVIPFGFILIPIHNQRCTPGNTASSPSCRPYLQDFMRKEFSDENFDFLVATALYRTKLQTCRSDDDILAAGVQIHDTFIAENSDRQVNITNSKVQAIVKGLAQPPLSENLFEAAEKEVWGIIAGDVYWRFIRSEHYLLMERELKRQKALKAVSIISGMLRMGLAIVREKISPTKEPEDWHHPFLMPDAFQLVKDARLLIRDLQANPLHQGLGAPGGGEKQGFSSITGW